ncbi:MAG TPA: CGNR zinc finger domain-containing protein, partial [Phototrophicaceae bacterium]|nr:CGNR zinc finger domain-containing protein [Phototrophicaceae bacterium]
SVELLNPLLNQAPVKIQIQIRDGAALHEPVSMQYKPQIGATLTLTQFLAVECALGIVELLQQHGLDRMRACAADPCQDVFVDTSRNKSRRFCSERCANRYNIAAFRERQKGNPDDLHQ